MPDAIVNGARLRYELTEGGAAPGGVAEGAAAETPAAGRAAPETIVFLNGIAMSIAHWKPVMGALGDTYRFLCHDMRGQTLSEKPKGPYSLEGHADDLAALMDELSIGKSHIVGTSYGAEVALAFALAYPGKCATLTLIDGVSELDPLLRAAAESWMAAALADPRTFYKVILPWNYSAEYISANAAALAAREDAVAALPMDWFEGFAGLCRAFLDINLTPKLNRITCPSLVLVGEKDILKHRGFAEIIASRIKSSKLRVLKGAGHAAAIEQPEAVAREIAIFLKKELKT